MVDSCFFLKWTISDCDTIISHSRRTTENSCENLVIHWTDFNRYPYNPYNLQHEGFVHRVNWTSAWMTKRPHCHRRSYCHWRCVTTKSFAMEDDAFLFSGGGGGGGRSEGGDMIATWFFQCRNLSRVCKFKWPIFKDGCLILVTDR